MIFKVHFHLSSSYYTVVEIHIVVDSDHLHHLEINTRNRHRLLDLAITDFVAAEHSPGKDFEHQYLRCWSSSYCLGFETSSGDQMAIFRACIQWLLDFKLERPTNRFQLYCQKGTFIFSLDPLHHLDPSIYSLQSLPHPAYRPHFWFRHSFYLQCPLYLFFQD